MRNKFAVIWIWLCLLPLAFDFKGVEAASRTVDILLTVTSMGAACAILLIAPRFARRSRMRTLVTSLFLLTIFGSVATQLLQGNDAGNYARVILPFLLMLLGYFVGCRPWDAQRLEQIERAMIGSLIASIVFGVGFDIAMSEGTGNMSMHVVPVTFLCLQGLLLHEFVFAQRIAKLAALLFLATIAVEIVCATPSLLVGTVLLIAYATWLAAPSIRPFFTAGLRAVAILTLLGAMAAATATFFPTVAQQFMQHMSFAKDVPAARDPVTIARLAEMKDQVDQTTSSTLSTMVGMGYGHDYRYSPSYLPDLAGMISEKDFYAIRIWAAGHDFWVYQFFAGGLLFGLALPLAVLWALWRGSMAYRAWRHRAPDAPHLSVLGRALFVLAALPATSIGGNPLGDRFSGVVFGVALGLVVASYARIAHVMQMRAAEAAGYEPPQRPPWFGTPPDMRPQDEPLPEILPANPSRAPGSLPAQ
ncbi:hypothetical protein IAG25_17060 [Caballeronia sp. EK]|uniref:Uncharacterized protein n=1 Tax=Caballeronia novacaledonica TaxID=1544861 RepID=A0AA37ICC2_9BURK|nr:MULTISPECIES: hypothetical protein [Caballeronia]MBC8638526.1 hypothetical protein [Caballeronia sp. EK]GJH25983.1 hypothetical protein CBA19CS42_15725 [Caballeronia novacaledonica]